MIIDKRNLFLALLLMTVSLIAQTDVNFEEDILAVVEKSVITRSEVEVALMMDLEGELPADSAQYVEDMRQKVEELIEERLILFAAEQESIVVEQSRVKEMFEQRWEMLVSSYGGESALENALIEEGYTLETFKRKTKKQIADFLKKQSYIEQNFGRILVTEDEIEEFYETYKDSLPPSPPEVHIAAIVISIKPSQEELDKALQKLENAKVRIENGEDFGAVASEVSEDEVSAKRGGVLGKFDRGSLVEPLDSLAFSLEVGEIGGPIYTPMGFHLVKVISKTGFEVEIAHILVTAAVTPGRKEELSSLADSIYGLAFECADFVSFAESLFNNGIVDEGADFGWVVEDGLGKDLKKLIIQADEGELIGPVDAEKEYQIIKVLGRREGHTPDLDSNKQYMKELTRQLKLQKLIEKHVDDLKDKFYVEMRI